MKKREVLLVVVLALILPCVALGCLASWETEEPPKPAESEAAAEIQPIPVVVYEEPAEVVPEEPEEPELVSLGEFVCTAYCSCRTCCGRWAIDRPLDENGNEIVYTASGAVAEQGVTIAVDTDVIPFGTVVVIDGQEYIAQDTGYLIEGKRIDVYHDDHQAAREYEVQIHEVFVERGSIYE